MPEFTRAARAAALAIAALISIGSSSAAWSFDLQPTTESASAPADPAIAGSADLPANAPSAVSPGAAEQSIPAALPPRSLADVVKTLVLADETDAELECLASAVYFESRGEPVEGQLAVAEVVLNRAASGRYPRSLCGVVTQRAQFSFVRAGRLPRADKSSEAWRTARAVAQVARNRLAEQVAPNVLWYHATYVSPVWGRRLTRVAQIGAHIFYS
jgi:spore germination cell wall hydrolase CwlJ-like protein